MKNYTNRYYDNGSETTRKWFGNGSRMVRQMCAAWGMLRGKCVNYAKIVMQIFKLTKLTEQIFAESAESAKPIFATYATYASANFVGKESNESTVRYALWSRISLIKPLQNPYLSLTRFRLSLGSNLSRFSLVSLICVLMLTLGVGSARGGTLKTSDLTFGTPDYEEDFEDVTTTSRSNTSTAQTITDLTGYGVFTHAYLGKTSNGTQTIAVKAAASPMTSKYFELTTTSNYAGVSFSRTFANTGAFSFKIAKASVTNVGLYNEVANGTVAHNKSCVYIHTTGSAVQMSSGSGWVNVENSLPNTDVLEITVIYNNTNSNTTYGDDVSLSAHRAHVFINGNAKMNGAGTAPQEFTIPSNTLTAFRIHYNATGTGKVDDIKIYDNLPTAASSCGAPMVGAPSNSSVTQNSATVSCSDGITKNDCDIAEWGFYFKTGSSGVTTSDTKHQVSAASSSTSVSGYSWDMTSLTANTHYYVKAYAIVDGVTTLSSTETDFTTCKVAAPNHVDITASAEIDGYGRYTTGETISLTATAYSSAGTGSPISSSNITGYQWQKYKSSDWADLTDGEDATDGGTFSGTTSANLQISGSTTSNVGSYRCLINTGASCSTASSGYMVRVFTLHGQYYGGDWSDSPIVWTSSTSSTGTVTLSLTGSSTFMFKVLDNDNKGYGREENNFIIEPWNQNCNTNNYNIRLFTGPAGNYVFTIDVDHAEDSPTPYVNVQVAYPSVTHPVEGYVYIDKWWDCYVHYWYDGSNKLTNWGSDPQITRYTTICDKDYWYFPVIDYYSNFIAKNKAGDATDSNTTGDQSTTSHGGKNITNDGSSWGWVSFYKYDITYDKGTGSGDAMASHEDLCPGSNQALTACSYSKLYNTFAGWTADVNVKVGESTIPAGSTIADEATIKDIQSDINLTAQWAVIPVTALTLNYSSLKKYVGESTVTLSVASVTPATADPSVTWTSTDGTVASVTSAGVVSFLKAGTATITATSTVTGTTKATCSVEVRSISSPTMQDEDGTAISSGDGKPSASWTLGTRTLTANEGTSLYKFKRWIVTNATPGRTTDLTTTLGDPTGNVTVVAEFYKPRVVTKGTGTGTSTFSISAASVKYGTSVTVTCAPTDGYKNPWTLTVTPSDGATYTSSASTANTTISNITKDITVDLEYTDKGCTTHGASSITSGASSGDDYGPIHPFYKYSTSQILYTKSDLGLSASTKKGTIKSIYFEYSGSAAMDDRSITIYMANTSLTSLAINNYVSYSSFTKVYEGTFGCSSTGWYEIEFSTSFEYNGVGNLVVMVDDNTGSYQDNKNFKYHSATGKQIYKRQDSGDIDPETWTPSNALDVRPNTKFCIEEADMQEATVNWYVNGEIVHTQTDYEGTTLSDIPTPTSSDCDDVKKFVGWYTSSYSHATDAPDFVSPKVIPDGGADYYAVFATENDGTSTATFNASDITGLTESPTKTWTHDASGVTLTLVGSNSQHYTGSPKTWTIGYNTSATASHYATITSSTNISQIDINLSDDDYPVNSVTNGTLTTDGSDATKQQITGTFTTTSLYPYCTAQSGVQARISSLIVTYATTTYSDYATTCCTKRDINLTSSGSVTGGTFNSGGVAKACSTKEITLTASPSNEGYVFNGWTVTNSSTSADVTSTVLGSGHEGDNPATMTMPDYNVTVTAAFSTISSISVKTAPTKTVYLEDETFDPTALVITASYANGTTVDVPYSGNEASFTLSPTTATALTTSNDAVTITYSGKTVDQSITVYSVTLQALDENGDAIRVGGPAAPTRVGATVTKAANVDNYVYKEWVVSGATLADGGTNQKIITDPTGDVTVTVKYYLPRTIRWLVNGEEWTPYTTTGSGTDGTAEVARGAQWKTLTLPTDPNPLNDEGCGQKFIGWTRVEIDGELDKDDDADAITTLINDNLLNSANKSGKTTTINANPYTFYAVFADYVGE